MARYFVLHLTDADLARRGLQMADKRFEIQVLDRHGRGKERGFVGNDETELKIAGRSVPSAVLDAARRQPLGEGDYVNERGDSIPPF